MQVATDRCPCCNKKFFYYDSRQYFCGSPIRTFRKCGGSYIDKRYHELAIEGLPGSEFSKGSYLFLIALGAYVLYRGIHLIGYRELGMSDTAVSRWLLPVVFTVMGLVLIIGGIIELIRIISGSKARKWEQKRQQSVARLRNPDYAWKLKQAGYPVPEEYLR